MGKLVIPVNLMILAIFKNLVIRVNVAILVTLVTLMNVVKMVIQV